MQTLLSEVLPWRAAPVGGERHEVLLADGDRLVIRHMRGTSGVLVHLMHGLTGDATSGYVRALTSQLIEQGHGVLAMNHRGCGEGRGLCQEIYHAGRKEDISAVVAFGRSLEPGSVQIAVGVSLSGNALLLALEDEGLSWPDAALAINPPVDLAACSDAIGKGLSRLYEASFMRRLRSLVRERERDGLPTSPHELPRGIGFRGFDEHFTAPLGGFAGADDYYRRCSSGPRLGRVAIPTVILTAADDPFVPVEGVLGAAQGTSVEVHVEHHGGHLGYLSCSPQRRWLTYAVSELLNYLASVVSRS